MNNYISGTTIKELREKRNMTQLELANILGVSDKAVSKWETSKGFPDISLIEPLSKELGVSVIELLTGDCISNRNVTSNMLKTKLYVCPVCGNVIHTIGAAEARFQRKGHGKLLAYCNKHALFGYRI